MKVKVNKFELAPFYLISLGARGDVTVWLKPNRSFTSYGFYYFLRNDRNVGVKRDGDVLVQGSIKDGEGHTEDR